MNVWIVSIFGFIIKRAACERLLHVFSFLFGKYVGVQFFNFKRNYQAGLQGGHTYDTPTLGLFPHLGQEWGIKGEGRGLLGGALAREQIFITSVMLHGDDKLDWLSAAFYWF